MMRQFSNSANSKSYLNSAGPKLPSGNEWKPYANDIRSARDSSIAFRLPSCFMKNRRPALKKMIAEPGAQAFPSTLQHVVSVSPGFLDPR